MTSPITEWEFTADAASWINELLAKVPSLPFSRATCEARGTGSLERRDLTILDKDKVVVLTGEVKLPFQNDGGSPYIESVVQDARKKAKRAGADFFFTWNVNECVLWETFPDRTAQRDRKYKSWTVTSVHKPLHLEIPSTERAIQSWLTEFLHDFAKILRGAAPIGIQPPDERFVERLESLLKRPIVLTLEELEKDYKKPGFKSELDKWMREEQGWLIYDDPEGVRDNLERAAKFACYAFVNKLVFHEALLKRYYKEMEKLSVPEHIHKGDELRLHLEGYFGNAKKVTGDYETVFGEEHTGIGNHIPFYSDSAVPHWRTLIDQIHDFDFSKLDYEVIGTIFERLISPEERHKYGQFYTRPEVVDLINSFCILKADDKVMDPACGGGTFLVRAYARKRELEPERKHGQHLLDLFGVDVSEFAAHLTTINLATRNLIDDENYPQIARSDFFDIKPNKKFLSLPSRFKAKGLGKMQHRDVQIPPLDAVIGNPPYVRQEDIPKANKKNKNNPPGGTKEYYKLLVKNEMHADLNARSDIHCYFWPHAASFLKENGYLCLLTSSQWLDVEYGFGLQEWILKNFEIKAVFESLDEPWFVGARVATAVTILRRQGDEKLRMGNTVRFVQLRRPIREILSYDNTGLGAVYAVNLFRDKILNLDENTVNERFRARLVRQGELWEKGVLLGMLMGKSKSAGTYDRDAQDGEYYGGKWGVYLRAPDLWFDLMDDLGDKFAPLGDLAEVRFGVKSGKDCFFFPRDCSADCLSRHEDPTEFEETHGVPRNIVASGKVKLVRCGEGYGEIRPIEARYLEPEVHSLMEVDGFTVAPEDCARQVLLVGETKAALKGTRVLEYIKWGEKQKYHTGATCSARVTKERGWYDLTGHDRAPALWPKERQYRHIAPANDDRLIANCRLYEIYPPKKYDDPELWGGILNSTWCLLSSLQFGRPVGNVGNWSTMVVDVNMMLVPDPRKANPKEQKRIARAFKKLKERKALYFLSERRLREMAYTQKGKEAELDRLSDECELDMADRRELDDAVLEMMGVKPRKRRQELTNELYAYLRRFFEWTRQKEEKAIANKNIAKRRGMARPSDIAAQIFDEIKEEHSGLLRRYDPGFIDMSKPFDTFEVPAEGRPEEYKDLFVDHGVAFVKGKKRLDVVKTKISAQAPLIVLLAGSGVHGLVRVPHEEHECDRVLKDYGEFVRMRKDRVREMIENRTADEDLREKIHDALMPLILGAG